jgi:hypothetical protein
MFLAIISLTNHGTASDERDVPVYMQLKRHYLDKQNIYTDSIIDK